MPLQGGFVGGEGQVGHVATTTVWIHLVQFTTLLDTANKAHGTAMAAAYSWTDYTPEMPDNDILQRWLALNLSPIHRQRARLSRQEIQVCQ